MELLISQNAIDRAIDYIPGVTSEAQAIAALDTVAMQKAAEFCGDAQILVRIPCGERIVAQCGAIITVIARHKAIRAARFRPRYRAVLVEE